MARRAAPSEPLVVVMGTTGTGKSDLAVELAHRFNGEIINADAMQMYRGLPVITNKISAQEQRGIHHHLFDTIGLEEETWDAGVFKREATRVISEIRQRGKLPIVVGGTHYYANALLFDQSLVEEPSGGLTRGCETVGNADTSGILYPILEGPTDTMLVKLREVDPVMADRWHPNDRRKIRRSLEIYLTTGKRASDIYAEQKREKDAKSVPSGSKSLWQTLLFWVYSNPEVLNERLDTRVDKMMDNGLIEETRELRHHLQDKLRRGEQVDRSKGIWQSIGFKQIEPYLDGLGENVEPVELKKRKERGVEDIKAATRRYAKYQIRWITKKMIPPLQQDGTLNHLYLLDSSDVSQWSHNVANTAARITTAFLDGERLPSPATISDTAEKVLSGTVAASNDNGTPCRRTCDVCNVTVLTEELWSQHLKGRQHRAMSRHKKRTAIVAVDPSPEQTPESQGRTTENEQPNVLEAGAESPLVV